MVDLELAYGTGRLRMRVPAARLLGSHPARMGGGRPPAEVLAAAARELSGAVGGSLAGARLGLLLPDGTRGYDPEPWLAALAPVLARARTVRAFLCTGTHSPDTPENRALAERVSLLLGLRCEVRMHDARQDEHETLGRTSRGTPVEVAAAVLECDALLAASDMRVHYFAGYSNAGKCLVPGLTSLATTRANHALALEPGAVFGRHPWHVDPARRTNPLAEDLVEAFALAAGERPHFALAQVGTSAGLVWAGGGCTAEVSARGMAAVDAHGVLALPETRYLMLSAGGAPHDESLYTVQRALELVSPIVRDGGEILFLARCPNGYGPPGALENFVRPLEQPLERVLAARREDYVLYGHKPVKLARILRRLSRVHLVSDLPDDAVRALHMHPVSDPQEVVDGWLAGSTDAITVVDDGASLAAVRT